MSLQDRNLLLDPQNQHMPIELAQQKLPTPSSKDKRISFRIGTGGGRAAAAVSIAQGQKTHPVIILKHYRLSIYY